jgi:AcrR family transcriptional regulator
VLIQDVNPQSGQNPDMSRRDPSIPWSGEPLPRRHSLSPEAVRASQRDRLLRAMEELVGELGYEATSVPKVISAARVSSNTFYALFRDKTDCFIALCERHGDELFAELSDPEGPADVEEGLANLDRGLHTYLRHWLERPAMARAYFVELPAAGPRAVAERQRQYDRFSALHRAIAEQARSVLPDAPPVREVDVRSTAILMTELVAREIREGRLDRLEELHSDLRHVLLTLLVSSEAAAGAERRERRG